jgi:hypothetical protein
MSKFAGRWVPSLVVLSLVCSGLTATASADSAKPRSTHGKSKHKAKKHKASKKKVAAKGKKAGEASGPLHGVVPPAQTAIFSALKGPAVHELPPPIVRSLSSGKSYEDLGIDGTQARLLGPFPTPAQPLYLIPGKRGICLFLNDGGSVCTAQLSWVAAYGISVDLVDPPKVNADGTLGLPTHVISLGAVPDGFTTVTAATIGGRSFTAGVINNGYLMETDGAIASGSRTLSGPGLASVTDPGGLGRR